MNQLLSSRNVKVRKQRQCYSCLRVFPIGTKMNYSASIYEDDFCALYSCLTCEEIIGLTPREYLEDGIPEGFVREALEKGETPEQHLEKMKLVNPK